MRVLPIAMASAFVLGACSPKSKAERGARDDAGAAQKTWDKAPQAKQVVPELLVLRQVLVEESSDQGSLVVHGSDMAKSLGTYLVTSGFVASRPGDVPETHLPRRIEVILSLSYDWAPRAAPDSGALVLAAEARIEFVDGRSDLAPRVAVLMQATVPRIEAAEPPAKVAQEALDALSKAAIESMANSLVNRERLRQAPHAELLSALSVGLQDPSMKIWALQIASDRGLREAVPAAAKALRHEDENLRAAGLAALVEFKDPASVEAITKDVDFNDHEELAAIIEAISVIGGEDASEFLEFVASGHPDADVRTRAKTSLQRLRTGDSAVKP